MNAETLKHTLTLLRERLTGQRSSQRRTLAAESGRFSAKAPNHMAEQAAEAQELDMLVSRLNSSSATLALIDDALDRLDAGQFNVCGDCGMEIGERRLTAQPWATLCVACQRLAEEER